MIEKAKEIDKREMIILVLIMMIMVLTIGAGYYLHTLETRYNECAVKLNEQQDTLNIEAWHEFTYDQRDLGIKYEK